MSTEVLSIEEAWRLQHGSEEHVPPAEVQAAVARGLDIVDRRSTTLGERARARRIADGLPQPAAVLQRFAEFHAHMSKSEQDEAAFLLHGGEAGRRWAEDTLRKTQNEEERPQPPDDHVKLRRRIGLLLGAHGDEGAPLEVFREHVAKHGHRAVARALRDLGADHHGGRVYAGHRTPPTSSKAKAAKKKPKKERPARDMKKAIESEAWRPFRFRGAA